MADQPARAGLANQLRALGLGAGDAVLVRAALSALGDVPDKAETFIDALMDVVGPEGLIMGLAFGRMEMPGRRNISDPFDPTSDPIRTGAFAAALAKRPGAVRSSHPTNSFVAWGQGANDIMAEHTPDTFAFFPMRHLIHRGGKMLLVGCTQSSPGFSTVHLAQFDLGLSRSLFSLICGRYIRENGRTVWWRRRDNPGCSQGFGKFYPLYRDAGLLHEGRVGQADSMLIDAAPAYAVEHAALSHDPGFSLCDRDTCYDDRLMWLWKRPEPIRFLKGFLRRG